MRKNTVNTQSQQEEYTGLVKATTGEQIATVWQKMLQQGATPQLMVELHKLAQEVINKEEEITSRSEEAIEDGDRGLKDATLTAIIELMQ
jgi:hypothetical protein